MRLLKALIAASGGRGLGNSLPYASQQGAVGAVELLLANGANVSERDSDGHTALMLVCMHVGESYKQGIGRKESVSHGFILYDFRSHE